MWYLRENAGLGFSVQQMFQGRFQPVNQSYDLYRNYNFNAYRKFALSPYLNLSTHIFYGLHKTSAPNIALITVFEVQEKIDIAINYRHNKALVFMAGLRKISIGSSAFSLYFSYLVPTGNLSVRDNALEINLSFQK
jgi:hypothetical protein